MKKPYVIIHTLTSLDGRIRNIELPEFDSAALQYEQLALHALRWTLLATWAGRRTSSITAVSVRTWFRC